MENKFCSMWVQLYLIDYSDYSISLISRINEVMFFPKISLYRYFIEKLKLHLSHLFCCSHACYFVNMVSATSVSRNITPASRYHPRYQSRSSMYIRGLTPQNLAELAKAVPIEKRLARNNDIFL